MRTHDQLLHVYLRDHLAGATGGSTLARRLAANHRGTWAGPELATIAEEVESDKQALVDIMDTVGADRSGPKVVAAALIERIGRLKLNGAIVRRSPLSTIIEIEMMKMGVEGKASGWRTLRELAQRDHRLDADRMTVLIERAEKQAAQLERIRVRSVADQLIE